jgi:hypothetical protein
MTGARSQEFNLGTVYQDAKGKLKNAQDTIAGKKSRVGRKARKGDPIDQDRSGRVKK